MKNLWTTVNNMNLEEEYYLLQDDDPKHTSKVVQNFLKTMDVEQVTKFPPKSKQPHLNPIEDLWPTHAKRVYARNPRNLQELKICNRGMEKLNRGATIPSETCYQYARSYSSCARCQWLAYQILTLCLLMYTKTFLYQN